MSGKNSLNQIEYIIVLVQENQSFDRKFGYSQIVGTDSKTGEKTRVNGLDPLSLFDQMTLDGQTVKLPVTQDADPVMAHDPAHEFVNVQEQLCGPGKTYDNTVISGCGYVAAYAHDADTAGISFDQAKRVMAAFSPDVLPATHALASEYCLCDNWRASLPGPTWPNRYFLHAATSGGLIASPDPTQLFKDPDKINRDAIGFFKFKNGTIYDRLEQAKISWGAYYHDMPQIASLDGMAGHMLPGGRVKSFSDFRDDIMKGALPHYVFIEPDYKTGSNFSGGNSEHAVGDIRDGEKLIKDVYEIVRSSPVWEKCLLVVVYDEHGGYFDHVMPERDDKYATGDDATYNGDPVHFDFKTLGVRVPALLISPWISKNRIDHTLYDHASLLATVEKRWGLKSLTNRDANANSFEDNFAEQAPRQDTPITLPDVPEPSEADAQRLMAHTQDAADHPLDGASKSFLDLARLIDINVNGQAVSDVHQQVGAIQNKGDASAYIRDVLGRVGAVKGDI